ncbi:hypothetical protein ACH5RR_021088 [Cinchona calisaya]|uniref:COX VIIa-like protein n=1 Tax=Cinchona calisaya TaxID=153742 RepID=A0ABD2ZHB3_9GENT
MGFSDFFSWPFLLFFTEKLTFYQHHHFSPPTGGCSFVPWHIHLSPEFCTFLSLTLKMTEAPFRPREKLMEKQKYFQNIHKHTYLKGPLDKITSVAIPLALAATCSYMIARGIYNLSHGTGKKE